MLLLIDNYDSFTWNLVQRLAEIDPTLDIQVVRNDKISIQEIEHLAPAHIIVSPGPCTPLEAGISNDVITHFAGRTPILGVCLGHQCIGHVHSMPVVRHSRIVHGKTSAIQHDDSGVFADLPNPFIATRYHSLVIPRDAIPEGDRWTVSAWTTDTLDDGSRREVVMGLRMNTEDALLEGVQFHPESFLTKHGPSLLANFLRLAPAS